MAGRERPGEVDAVGAGELEVGDDQRHRARLARGRHRGRRVLGGGHRARGEAGDQARDHRPHQRVVVDDEHDALAGADGGGHAGAGAEERHAPGSPGKRARE